MIIMLTKEELRNIEKILDDTGIVPGLYRDGYCACLRDMVESVKSKIFEEMVQQAFIEAMLKAWAEATANTFVNNMLQAFKETN